MEDEKFAKGQINASTVITSPSFGNRGNRGLELGVVVLLEVRIFLGSWEVAVLH